MLFDRRLIGVYVVCGAGVVYLHRDRLQDLPAAVAVIAVVLYLFHRYYHR